MHFPAELSALPQMMDYVQNSLQKVPFSKGQKRKIELALEEALVNIIHYAYPLLKSGSIDLSCTLVDNNIFEVVIQDEGHPFNPLQLERPIDLHSDLEERQAGGLGIYFILELMDHVTYERKGKHNILRLQKRY